MKNIYLNIYKPSKKNLIKAKRLLRNNKVIVLPTETVYGLAGNAYSDISVSKIFNLKKRPKINPLIVHFKNLKNLEKDVILNNDFKKLYKAFCPGPITFILKKNKRSRISKIATVGKNTVAIRFPSHRVAKKLLSILNFPLAAPSANISSKLSATSVTEVLDEFKNKIKFILDGGKCIFGVESTIIDLTSKPNILRPGVITIEKIKKILKKKITLNKPIIMGRKTFASIGKPLPNRRNVILTRNKDFQANGCDIFHSKDEALTNLKNEPEIMIIGGSSIYREFMPLATTIYLTVIDAVIEGDTYFPELEQNSWQLVNSAPHLKDQKNKFNFKVLTYKKT